MFKPAALFIGLRYTRAKRKNHFISFISLVSMIGIALGVAVLITVLSVMNGFDDEIKKRVFSMVSPVTVSSTSGNVLGWKKLQDTLENYPDVTATAPFVRGEVLISHGGAVQPAVLNGILPAEESKVTQIADKMVAGKLTDLSAQPFGIVIGQSLADNLGVMPGEKITVVTPQVSLSPAGVMPRYKRFKVIGIFRAGTGFGFDNTLGFVNLNAAQKLFGLGEKVSGIHLNIENVFQATKVAQYLSEELNSAAIVSTWAEQFGEFFRAVQLEKTMMFMILLLIIAVAAFNLVSTLVMVVNEKQSDIAILRTFGATPTMILQVFIIQGGLVGVIGTFLGVTGGILLALNVTDIVNWIEHAFHIQFLSANVYFVNYLPSKIEWLDVAKISFASLFLSLIATLYPAWRASKMDPVESLRYE